MLDCQDTTDKSGLSTDSSGLSYNGIVRTLDFLPPAFTGYRNAPQLAHMLR